MAFSRSQRPITVAESLNHWDGLLPRCGDLHLKRILLGIAFVWFGIPSALIAQFPSGNAVAPPARFTYSAPFDPLAGGFAGGGQVEPAAFKERFLTRLGVASTGSTLGTGLSLTTNLPYRIDLRVFGNYTNFDWKQNQSGFYLVVNIAMSNLGAQADYYPWKSLRFSPGVLVHNTDHINATLQAGDGATFTLNNVTYISDNAKPIFGVGGIKLGGTGFMATSGWGHYVSRNEKRWHFPFEAGAAFISQPTINFALKGDVCTAQGFECASVTTYPGLRSNLNAQLASWNKRAAPFHIYPIVQFGLSYTFRYRR